MPERALTNRTVYIVPHTHWDREWYAPFQTFRAQLVDLWDELLAMTESDPDFRFLMDGQTVVIDDYLAIRPEARPRIDRAVRAGRIEVGPWYTLPDEFLVSAETLVRNLQRGLAAAAVHGGSLAAGYLPDSFGHAAQMPQIYRQFGFGHAVVWRGVPLAINRLAFTWEAPDGTDILTAYMGSSYSHGVDLPTEPMALARRIEAALKALAVFHPSADVLLMNGNDHVLPQRKLSAAIRAAGPHLGATSVRLAGLGDYLRTLNPGDGPRWQGELRSSARANVLMGTLSVRIPDKQRYFEATQRLERIAEPLAAFSGVEAAGLLTEAWTHVLHNAAHDTACGSGIDAVAEEARLRSDAVGQLAAAITARCLPRLAGDGQVWNPSPFPRRDLVELEVDEDAVSPGAQALTSEPGPERMTFRFPAEEVGRVHAVLDERRVLGQHIGAIRVRREGTTVCVAVETRAKAAVHDLTASRLEIERLADQPNTEAVEITILHRPRRRILVETPTIAGCSVTNLVAWPNSVAPVLVSGNTLENERLRCHLARDGTITVADKVTGITYEGLNRLVDEGDAGDEYNFSSIPEGERGDPDMLEAPCVAEAGPLRGSLRTRFRYWVPAALRPDRGGRDGVRVPLCVTVSVSLQQDLPRLDFAIEIENLARDHRLRTHFPLPFTVTESHADTVYHVTPRAVGPGRWDPGAPEMEVPTYPMRSFVTVGGDGGGLALISHGLHEYEVIDGTPKVLALTLLRSVGWLSRDDLKTRIGHAGPPMETPGAQALGTHHFRYSLLFHSGNWEAATIWRQAECALLPLVLGSGEGPAGNPPVVELEPDCVQMTACVPRADGYDLRLLNASERAQDAIVRLRPEPARVLRVTLGGEEQGRVAMEASVMRLPMRRWEIATLRIERSVPPR